MSRTTKLTHARTERSVPIRSLLLCGLGATALAGCATPDYPIRQGYAAPPPIKPTYPIRQESAPPATAPADPAGSGQPSAASAATEAAAQTESTASPSTAAPSPAAVESAPLPPITDEASAKPVITRVSTDQATNTSQTPPAPPPATGPAPAGAPVTSPATTAPSPTASEPAYRPPAPRSYEPQEAARPVRRTETRLVTDGRVVAARGMYRDYDVREGDHLDAIARDLETTREELIRANRLKKPYRIHPGQHIRVPVTKAYVAQGGDSLSGIARRFGVGLGELADLNDLPARGRLTPGMYIALPAHYEDHGPTRESYTQEVFQRPATTYRPPSSPRPEATYQTARRAPAAPTYVPGSPYSPSAEALAAANARREALNRPTPSYPSTTYTTPRSAEAPADTTRLASLGVGKFIWPVKGPVVSPFGAAGMGRRNDGVDIGAPEGSEVKAAAVGEVVYAGDQVPGFGNLVLIKHAGGWVSAYAHLAHVDVHMRDTVYQGQEIGTVGETGGAAQPELHFELRYAATPEDKAKPLDPLQVLPR